jgi:hypothetical protein
VSFKQEVFAFGNWIFALVLWLAHAEVKDSEGKNSKVYRLRVFLKNLPVPDCLGVVDPLLISHLEIAVLFQRVRPIWHFLALGSTSYFANLFAMLFKNTTFNRLILIDSFLL